MTANAGSDGPNVGSGQQHNPGGGNNPILGCTDPSASNYNSSATEDNGSCRYPNPQVRGCTDPGATNYNSSATVDDGSCHYTPPPPVVAGCTDPSATNYNSNATVSNGSCHYPPVVVPGCMDPLATNYNPLATTDNHSCTYPDLPPIPVVNIPVASVGGNRGSLFKPLPVFDTGIKGNAGDTVLGNPLAGLKAPGAIELTPLVRFDLPLANFLFAPLPNSIQSLLNSSPKLKSYLASVGVTGIQGFAGLQSRQVPLRFDDIDNSPPGIFTVMTSTSTQLSLYLSTDSNSQKVIEIVKVQPSTRLKVSLVPFSNGVIRSQFNGDDVDFSSPSLSYKVSTFITSPSDPGRYMFTTTASPIPLAVDVIAPPQAPPANTSWWQSFVNWFGHLIGS